MDSVQETPKLCECGCGQPAPIARQTIRQRGVVKGQPLRYISGHNVSIPPTPIPEYPPHLCECGCGQITPLAKCTDPRKGTVKGRPCQFRRGHGGSHPRLPVEITADGVRIPLTGNVACIVSPEDADLAQYLWHPLGGYAARSIRLQGRCDNVFLHSVVLARILGRPLQPDEECDHRDGNRLDNRRANLRTATRAQNQRNKRRYANNTSGSKGVNLVKNGRWRAKIRVSGKQRHLGYYATREAATEAYERAAAEWFGEFKRE